MGGVFDTEARPKLADAYFDWEGEQALQTEVSTGGIVAITGPSSWGPTNTAKLIGSMAAFDHVKNFGSSDTALRRAVYWAFKGEGTPGRGGASAVLVIRQATSAAAAAARTLQNTAGTPANAITFTAKYPGTRGNALRLTVQAGDPGKNELLVLDGSLVVERYPHATTALQALVDDVNAHSDWITAALLVGGTPLAAVSSVALTGGNDGASLTASEFTAAWALLDGERWSVYASHDLTDSSIRASLIAWEQQRNLLGRRCVVVGGGAAGESIATANTRSTSINDYQYVNLGGVTLHDDVFNIDVSTSQFAPRVAGSIAGRGEAKDMFFVRYQDVSFAAGSPVPSLAEQEAALNAGTTTFVKDTAGVPVFIREAVTTYTDDSLSPVDDQGVKTHPVKFYKRIKNIRIQQGIELETSDYATSGEVLGDQPVDSKTRDLIVGFVKTLYQRREDNRIVQPGWTVTLDPAVPISDDDDFVQYLHGFHPTRSLRQMFNRARVG